MQKYRIWTGAAALWCIFTTLQAQEKNDIRFEPLKLPKTLQERYSLRTTDTVWVNGQKQQIGFTPLMHTGIRDNGEIYGQLKDSHDTPLFMRDGAPYLCNGTSNPLGSGSGLDHVSILQKKGKFFMVSQFECQIGAYYINELQQDANGTLKPKAGTLRYISEKQEFGGYGHCAGMKTPWESHLGSEEYPADARRRAKSGRIDLYYNYVKNYWKDLQLANPYYHGWIPEIKVNDKGEVTYTKHYAMGRFSHELAYVMPDRKTVYMTDDGTNTGFFMFKADKAEDLSSGTLYAARWVQTGDTDGGSARLEWIRLGASADKEIRMMLDPDNDTRTNDGLRFEDIFETGRAGETCRGGFVSINTESGFECLKIKPGMEKAAAFLETRRYAAMHGATTEFRKGEGITFDAGSRTLYVSMSEIAKGMEDKPQGNYDKGGQNHIRLPYNPCGTVYALKVDEAYEATQMQGEIVGSHIKKFLLDSCAAEGLANPDNLTFLKNSDILVIGEDSSYHDNNMVWAYDVKQKKLDRLMTLPEGAEATSPFWYPDINGYGYLLLVTQHPDTNSEYHGESGAGLLVHIRTLR